MEGKPEKNQWMQLFLNLIMMAVLLLFILTTNGCSGDDREKAAKLNNQGILYLRQGDYVKAEEKFEEAIKYCPECPEPYCNLADMYGILTKQQHAIDNKIRAEEREPTELSWHYYNKSMTYSRKARELMEKEIKVLEDLKEKNKK